MKHSAKDLLHSVAMAFSVFSRVPMPKVEWKPENQRYLLASFPLVGVLIASCSPRGGLVPMARVRRHFFAGG